MDDIQPMSAVWYSMLPVIIGSMIAMYLWLRVCRKMRHEQDVEYEAAFDSASLGMQYSIACRGRPSDRLFLRSIIAFALLGALYMAAWFFGVTPANKPEREFIDLVIQSSFQDNAKVKGLAEVVHNASYVSRRHFEMADKVFVELSRK